MTFNHSPDDEETSVYPVTQLPSQAAQSVARPQPAMRAVSPAPSPPAQPYAPPYPGPAAAPPVAIPPLYPAYRPAPYETSGRAGLAALILIIFGLTEAIIATLGAVFASTMRRAFGQLLADQGIRVEPTALTGVLTAMFLTLLLLGVLQVIAAGGILGHRRWGQWLGVLLCAAGSVAGAWLVYRVVATDDARAATLTLPLLVLIPYAIALLGVLFPGRHFKRGRRPA